MPRFKIIAKRRKAKLCVSCGKVPPEKKRRRCSICLEEQADDARARRRKSA